MIRRHAIVTLILTLITIAAAAPSDAGPFYSGNGIGSLVADDAGLSRAMGGAGVAVVDSLNLIHGNPALLTAFSGPSYSIGAHYSSERVYYGGKEAPLFAGILLDRFSLVIPLARGKTASVRDVVPWRVVIGWGLAPYSRSDATIQLQSGEVTEDVDITGGLNVSTTGLAFAYRDIVRIGMSLNYTFGMIEEQWKRDFVDEENIDTIDYMKYKFTAYSTTVGAVAKFGSTHIGASVTTKADLRERLSVVPGDFSYSEFNLEETNHSLPAVYRLGVSSRLTTRLTAAADMSFQQWEDAAMTANEKLMYNDSLTIGGGVRLSPDRRSPGQQKTVFSYFGRLPLYAGFKYRTMYYKSFQKNIAARNDVAEKSLTFGVELPFMQNRATLVTSCAVGTRGDKNDNGWTESFVNLGVLLVGSIR